jgi:hypothetical protein
MSKTNEQLNAEDVASICSDTHLKQIIVSPTSTEIKFDNLVFTANQIRALADWQTNHEDLKITIQLVTKKLL